MNGEVSDVIERNKAALAAVHQVVNVNSDFELETLCAALKEISASLSNVSRLKPASNGVPRDLVSVNDLIVINTIPELIASRFIYPQLFEPFASLAKANHRTLSAAEEALWMNARRPARALRLAPKALFGGFRASEPSLDPKRFSDILDALTAFLKCPNISLFSSQKIVADVLLAFILKDLAEKKSNAGAAERALASATAMFSSVSIIEAFLYLMRIFTVVIEKIFVTEENRLGSSYSDKMKHVFGEGLSRCILGLAGVKSLFAVMLSHCSDSDVAIQQAAKILCKPPAKVPLDEYLTNIFGQLSDILLTSRDAKEQDSAFARRASMAVMNQLSMSPKAADAVQHVVSTRLASSFAKSPFATAPNFLIEEVDEDSARTLPNDFLLSLNGLRAMLCESVLVARPIQTFLLDPYMIAVAHAYSLSKIPHGAYEEHRGELQQVLLCFLLQLPTPDAAEFIRSVSRGAPTANVDLVCDSIRLLLKSQLKSLSSVARELFRLLLEGICADFSVASDVSQINGMQKDMRLFEVILDDWCAETCAENESPALSEALPRLLDSLMVALKSPDQWRTKSAFQLAPILLSVCNEFASRAKAPKESLTPLVQAVDAFVRTCELCEKDLCVELGADLVKPVLAELRDRSMALRIYFIPIDRAASSLPIPEPRAEYDGDLQRAIGDLRNHEPALRTMGIDNIRDMFPLSPFQDRILEALLLCVNDDDPFVFLAAVRALAKISESEPKMVIHRLVKEFSALFDDVDDENERSRLERRTLAALARKIRIGEALLLAAKRRGETLPHYAEMITPALFLGARPLADSQMVEIDTKDIPITMNLLRASAMSLLGEVLFVAPHQAVLHALDVASLAKGIFTSTSETDEEVRHSALLLLHKWISGLLQLEASYVLSKVPRDLRDVSLILERTISADNDLIAVGHAQVALEGIQQLLSL